MSLFCMVCALAVGSSTDTEHMMTDFGGMGAAFYCNSAINSLKEHRFWEVTVISKIEVSEVSFKLTSTAQVQLLKLWLAL